MPRPQERGRCPCRLLSDSEEEEPCPQAQTGFASPKVGLALEGWHSLDGGWALPLALPV